MQDFLTTEELNIFILLFDTMLPSKNHPNPKFKLLGEILEMVFYYLLTALLSEILLGLELE